MTVTDEPSPFTPVDPEKGRSASARARAAAEGETPDGGALRAQPRARAHARGAVEKVRTVRDNRRAAMQARGSGAASSEGREESILEARPPSLGELGRRLQKGPMVTLRKADGTVAEESADWPDWQVWAWKAYMAAELVLVAAPTYVLLWATEKPGRAGWLAVLAGLVYLIAWQLPAAAPGGEG